MPLLSNLIQLKRRYYRSINLERDLDSKDALEGYVVTPRSAHALERILSAIGTQRASRAWTLTGAYGTGKSSFAHFLLSLCGPSQDPARKAARQILVNHANGGDLVKLVNKIGVRGLVRAVATGQREPVSHTVLKALNRGLSEYSAERSGRKHIVFHELQDRCKRLKPGTTLNPSVVLSLISEVANASETGLILVLDELGKALEFASLRQSESDLYLLQQLAELKSSGSNNAVFVVGLLHQSFADYGHALSAIQRGEWSKIQGRFEDIPFTNSANEAIRLISQAMNCTEEKWLNSLLKSYSKKWGPHVSSIVPELGSNEALLADLLPLHPVAAIALPLLCNRFAQNDRSLFTFLTSDEPHSFSTFLQSHECTKESLPTMKLDTLYDYFVDVVGANIHSRPHLSRWVEIQGRITEATGLTNDVLRVLKAIGILNLVASTGTLRATRNLVALSMCDVPDNKFEYQRWINTIDSLIEGRVIAYRRQLDELRVWEGSDFDIDQAIQVSMQSDRRPLDQLLNHCAALAPVVPQRHNYQFGTFRFFEQRFGSESKQLSNVSTESGGADGIVIYWTDNERPGKVPTTTEDGKPVILLTASNVAMLQSAAQELFALQRIRSESPELQTDGVARREVRQRTLMAKRRLDDVLQECFDLASTTSYVMGKKTSFASLRELNGVLSDVCDQTYRFTPRLHNELVNRRELTSQGAKARRELVDTLLNKTELAGLGLKGFGPEVSMYKSLLLNTGIHRLSSDCSKWEVGAPSDQSLLPVWQCIENYCLESIDGPRPVSALYELLSSAPYGIKAGIVPVLLVSALIAHNDDVCIYKDGSFVPILGTEHFELLVKDASRFAVKHFVTTGLRAQVFKEIEDLVSRGKAAGLSRNASLLSVVKPLVQFIKSLPSYTRKTTSLTTQAIAVRDAILNAKQPDELLFVAIPEALGLEAIVAKDKENVNKARELRAGLLSALRELQLAFDEMIGNCQRLLCSAFKIDEPSLRQSLRVRGRSLSPDRPKSEFDGFIAHILDEQTDDRSWLITLLMIIADRSAEQWSDEDFDRFKTDVTIFAKQFDNFESIQSSLHQAPGAGYEAKKITLTQPSGKETQKILWIDSAKVHNVNRLVDEIINEKLLAHPELYDAVVSKLTERLLDSVVAETKSRRSEG